jgi:hypothetical protein
MSAQQIALFADAILNRDREYRKAQNTLRSPWASPITLRAAFRYVEQREAALRELAKPCAVLLPPVFNPKSLAA